MKKVIRKMFIIITILWMITIFLFSNQPSDTSKNTSSFITRNIVKFIYGNKLDEKEFNQKVEEKDYIIRKLAHYTIYLCGGIFISVTMQTYELSVKKKILMTQGIREHLCNN